LTRRSVGVGLVAIAAFLYASRFVCAAIYGSGASNEWGADLFHNLYKFVGSDLSVAALVALIVGCAYLVWGEIADLLSGRRLSESAGERRE
jgi:hypothetical protein